MRLAVVTNMPSYHNVDLFNALAQRHECDLMVFYLREMTPGRQWKQLRTIKHPHKFLPELKLTPYWYFNPGLLKTVWKWKPDVLLVNQYASVGMQLLMYIWSGTRRKWIYWSEAPGVQYTEHLIVPGERLRHFLRQVALLPLRLQPEQIWGVGEYACRSFSSIANRKCHNVPYYFDQHAFLSIEPPRPRPERIVKFLFVGKLIYRKGFDLLIQAVEKLISAGKQFEVYVLGDGPDKALLHKASTEVRRAIKFIGFRELSEVPSVYANSDVLVFPTRYDGWGMAVVEAMAAARPVISSCNSVSATEVIRDNVNGFLLGDNNAHLLAKRMECFIDGPELVHSMGLAARADSLHFSAENGARRIVKLLSNNQFS